MKVLYEKVAKIICISLFTLGFNQGYCANSHVNISIGKNAIGELFQSAFKSFFNQYKDINFELPPGRISQQILLPGPVDTEVIEFVSEFFGYDLNDPLNVEISYTSPKLTAILQKSDISITTREYTDTLIKLDVGLKLRNPEVNLERLNICTAPKCKTGLFAKFKDITVKLKSGSRPIKLSAHFFIKITDKKTFASGFEANHKQIDIQYRYSKNNFSSSKPPQFEILTPYLDTPRVQVGPGAVGLGVTSKDIKDEIEKRKPLLANEILINISKILPSEIAKILSSALTTAKLPLYLVKPIREATKPIKPPIDLGPASFIKKDNTIIHIVTPFYPAQEDSTDWQTPTNEQLLPKKKKINYPSGCYQATLEPEQLTYEEIQERKLKAKQMQTSLSNFVKQATVGFGINKIAFDPDNSIQTVKLGFEPLVQLNWVNITPPNLIGNGIHQRSLGAARLSCAKTTSPYAVSISEPLINALLTQVFRQGLLDRILEIQRPLKGLSLGADGIKLHIKDNKIYIILNTKIRLGSMENWWARNLGPFVESVWGSTKGTLKVPIELPITLGLAVNSNGEQFLKITSYSPIHNGYSNHSNERKQKPFLTNEFGYPSNINETSNIVYNKIVSAIQEKLLEENDLLTGTTKNYRTQLKPFCWPLKPLLQDMPIDFRPKQISIENTGHLSMCGSIKGLNFQDLLNKQDE
jgi:hypothetical protein